MSEQKEEKEKGNWEKNPRPTLTPLMQELLIKEMNGAIDAINRQDYYGGWVCLRSLILSAPKRIKELCKSEMNVVQQQITLVNKTKYCMDLYMQSVTQRRKVNQICESSVLSLLDKVSDELYSGGYLEVGTIQPKNARTAQIGDAALG